MGIGSGKGKILYKIGNVKYDGKDTNLGDIV